MGAARHIACRASPRLAVAHGKRAAACATQRASASMRLPPTRSAPMMRYDCGPGRALTHSGEGATCLQHFLVLPCPCSVLICQFDRFKASTVDGGARRSPLAALESLGSCTAVVLGSAAASRGGPSGSARARSASTASPGASAPCERQVPYAAHARPRALFVQLTPCSLPTRPTDRSCCCLLALGQCTHDAHAAVRATKNCLTNAVPFQRIMRNASQRRMC
jgi:hypothetical protein